jgi:hypothetical protein
MTKAMQRKIIVLISIRGFEICELRFENYNLTGGRNFNSNKGEDTNGVI